VIIMGLTVDDYHTIITTPRKMIVLPIHNSPVNFYRYPLSDIELSYPMYYSHMRRMLDKGVDRGDIFVSEGAHEVSICWIVAARSVHVDDGEGGRKAARFYTGWLKDGFEEIIRRGYHEKYDIAIPALGVYEDDATNPVIFWKLARKYFKDSPNRVDFLLNW